MSYVVLEEHEILELERGVNEMLHDGYMPIGGVSFAHGKYIQAMFKGL